MKKTRRLLLTALFTLLKLSTLLAQNTIHIPGDAATIQGGINLARDGDTVLVGPGAYNENLDFRGKAITVTSGATSFVGASSTIIHGSGDGPVVEFQTGETSGSVLNGFTIEGGHNNPDNCVLGGGVYINSASPIISNNAVINNANYGVYVTGPSSPNVSNNNIKGNFYSDVGVTAACAGHPTGVNGLGRGINLLNADSPQVIGNTIEENNITQNLNPGDSPRDAAGIFINKTKNVLLKNNIIRNNIAQGESAIYALPQDEVTQHLVMVQNLVYGNRSPDFAQTGQIGVQVSIGGGITSRPTLVEVNNIIYGGQSLLLNYGPSIIENNIFANPAPGQDTGSFNGGLMCLDPEAIRSPITIQNNANYVAGQAPNYPCSLGSGNIDSDPQFRDPANGDFHAQDTSPTVGVGDINAPKIPDADLDNKARTVCNKIDMGVYELRPHPPVTISSSANPTPGGTTIIFTAQVTDSCKVPTGTITFYDGTTALGTMLLSSSATATLTASLLVVGQHNITAQYSGDFNFEISTSAVLVQTITGDPTTTSLLISPNPATALSPVTLSSQVTSPYGTPTGSVTFAAGGSILATATLNANGLATTTTALGTGTYQVVANYSADTRFQPSSSHAVQETIIGADSITTLTNSPNPSALTQIVTLTAAVHAAHGTTVPTGQVSFRDGPNQIGTIALNANGVAVLTSSSLSFGTHSITARYSGSNNFNPSGAGVVQSVLLIGTTLTLSATPNPTNTGQTVSLAATATSAVAGMTPVGTVTFYDGDAILGTVNLGSNGMAAFSTSSLSIGSHNLHAALGNSPYFAGSSSASVNETIQPYDFTLALSKTSLTMPSGDYSNISVTITPVGGFKGDVQLSCDGLPEYALCAFPDRSSVSLATGAKRITLSINAVNVYGYGDQVTYSASPSLERGSQAMRIAFLVPALPLLGLIPKRRRYTRALGVAFAFVMGASLMNGCSGKLPSKTAPGTYALSVTGTSANLKRSVPLQLNVTP